MLSYQHSYHAGNVADVHKHWLLSLIVSYLTQKPKPFCVLDMHAGRGSYDLEHNDAQKTGEYEQGIARLLMTVEEDAVLEPYLSLVRDYNPDGYLRHYPGSPAIVEQLLRVTDRLICIEKHPQEVDHLAAFLNTSRKNVRAIQGDASQLLPSLLPPIERRGLVLFDPSYEDKSDYETLPQWVAKAYAKWSTGIYMIWYPILTQGRHPVLLEGLSQICPDKWLVHELYTPHSGGVHMVGSGVAIINPPWILEAAVAADPLKKLFS